MPDGCYLRPSPITKGIMLMVQGNRGRSDAESRYLALLNRMTEAGHEMVRLEVPDELQQGLRELIAMCRQDFEKHFGCSNCR